MPATTLLEIPPERQAQDAGGPPPPALWLSAGVPYLTAVCSGPHSNGDCDG